ASPLSAFRCHFFSLFLFFLSFSFFFSHDTSPSEFYTLSLHDALPIYVVCFGSLAQRSEISALTIECFLRNTPKKVLHICDVNLRSEEHTSELQSRFDLVCRLLLEKKKNMNYNILYNDQ